MNRKIIIGIVAVIIILAVFAGFKYLKQEPQPTFVAGNETLEITILDSNSSPVQNIEVDLWKSENANGPPTAGISETDNSGKALFKVPGGNYLVGFNGLNFPDIFAYPEKSPVSVAKGETKKTIILEMKE